MTIKTLKYIHQLLVDEEQKIKEIYLNARKLQHEFEESEIPNKVLIKEQEKAADEYMKEHIIILNALEDFEAQEW